MLRSHSAPPTSSRLDSSQRKYTSSRIADKNLLRSRTRYCKSLQKLNTNSQNTDFAIHEWAGYWEYVTKQLDIVEIPSVHHIALRNCSTCRPYRNFPMYQHVVEIPLVGNARNAPQQEVKIIRVYHLSRDDCFPGSQGISKLELAVIDFLLPTQISEESRSYINHLGYTFEVRMGDPEEDGREHIWLARAMIDYCELPWKSIDYSELMSGMSMYSGPPLFNQFKPVDCPQTFMMFLKMMHLDKRGYRLTRVVKPDFTRGYVGFIANTDSSPHVIDRNGPGGMATFNQIQ